ncbi:unannotated protein [freshwater metagenome]|uniref:Unannotated protein n=1 Tax=freshwater metagenome TaxID=449393 RepID=A0A6J7HJT8_9ZZZZ|nr:hypothetical protein [Actinomycetota bacterium]
MDPERLALTQGLRDTRGAFARWNARPWQVLGPWLAVSFATGAFLLLAVGVIASLSTPDPTTLLIPGLNEPAGLDAIGHILFRNSLVLLLHALACVAGFIAGASLPLQVQHRTGFSRRLHQHAGPLAIAFVGAATLFSLCTQAWILGTIAGDLAGQLDVSVGALLLTLLPHALPELTALFLPLAAWLVASRRGEWEDLLAATFVTVAIAVPVLVTAALIEVYVWPDLLRLASPLT